MREWRLMKLMSMSLVKRMGALARLFGAIMSLLVVGTNAASAAWGTAPAGTCGAMFESAAASLQRQTRIQDAVAARAKAEWISPELLLDPHNPLVSPYIGVQLFPASLGVVPYAAWTRFIRVYSRENLVHKIALITPFNTDFGMIQELERRVVKAFSYAPISWLKLVTVIRINPNQFGAHIINPTRNDIRSGQLTIASTHEELSFFGFGPVIDLYPRFFTELQDFHRFEIARHEAGTALYLKLKDLPQYADLEERYKEAMAGDNRSVSGEGDKSWILDFAEAARIYSWTLGQDPGPRSKWPRRWAILDAAQYDIENP